MPEVPMPPKRPAVNVQSVVTVQIGDERAERLRQFVQESGSTTSDAIRVAIDFYLDAALTEVGA